VWPWSCNFHFNKYFLLSQPLSNDRNDAEEEDVRDSESKFICQQNNYILMCSWSWLFPIDYPYMIENWPCTNDVVTEALDLLKATHHIILIPAYKTEGDLYTLNTITVSFRVLWLRCILLCLIGPSQWNPVSIRKMVMHTQQKYTPSGSLGHPFPQSFLLVSTKYLWGILWILLPWKKPSFDQ